MDAEPRKLRVESADLPSHAPDMNAAVFDAAHHFRGCIPGILEILRRQGLIETVHCLNPHETLSPGQGRRLIVAVSSPFEVSGLGLLGFERLDT